MEIRIATDQDWKDISGVCEATVKGSTPMRQNSMAVAAYDNRLAGFWIQQAVFHTEPVWVRRDLRGNTFLWRQMADKLLTASIPVPRYAFAPRRAQERMLGMIGFNQVPWTIWRRE